MDVIERPVSFGGALVGTTTRPAGTLSPEGPAVVFLNAGIIHRVGPHRLYVRLARRLAAAGTASLRFDLPGIGDSSVPPGGGPSTVAELVDQSIDAALDYMEGQGHRDGFIVLGLCSGADNAFRTATRDPRVVGAVMLDPNAYRTLGYWVHHYGRRLFRGETWKNVITGRHPYIRALKDRILGRSAASEEGEEWPFLAPTSLPPREVMRGQLEDLIRRGVQLCYIFTAGLQQRYNHERQFVRTFPGLEFEGCLHHEYWPDSGHTFAREHLRHRLAETVVSWTRSSDFPRPPSMAPEPDAKTIGAG